MPPSFLLLKTQEPEEQLTHASSTVWDSTSEGALEVQIRHTSMQIMFNTRGLNGLQFSSYKSRIFWDNSDGLLFHSTQEFGVRQIEWCYLEDSILLDTQVCFQGRYIIYTMRCSEYYHQLGSYRVDDCLHTTVWRWMRGAHRQKCFLPVGKITRSVPPLERQTKHYVFLKNSI